MKRIAVLLLAVVVPLGWAAPAQADPPLREVIEVDTTFVQEECGFPVEIHIVATIIRTSYTDSDGTLTRAREVYPHYQTSLTNLDTGEALDVHIPGPALYTYNPDGSLLTLVGTGPWLWYPELDGEVGIFQIRGRFEQRFNPDGTYTFKRVGAPPIDICAILAA